MLCTQSLNKIFVFASCFMFLYLFICFISIIYWHLLLCCSCCFIVFLCVFPVGTSLWFSPVFPPFAPQVVELSAGVSVLRVHQWHTESKTGLEKDEWRLDCPVLWVDETIAPRPNDLSTPLPQSSMPQEPVGQEQSGETATVLLVKENSNIHVFTSSDQVFF